MFSVALFFRQLAMNNTIIYEMFSVRSTWTPVSVKSFFRQLAKKYLYNNL